MNIRPNRPESMTEQLLKSDLQKPIPISANEQLATETRQIEHAKGINLAVTSTDNLRTVLEELSHLRVWAYKSYAGKIKDSDKNVVQTRVDMILNDVKRALSGTEFNKVEKLSSENEPQQGSVMKIKNSALETLGIEFVDIGGDVDLEAIDKAINTVRRALHKGNLSPDGIKNAIADSQPKRIALFEDMPDVNRVNESIQERKKEVSREIFEKAKTEALEKAKIEAFEKAKVKARDNRQSEGIKKENTAKETNEVKISQDSKADSQPNANEVSQGLAIDIGHSSGQSTAHSTTQASESQVN